MYACAHEIGGGFFEGVCALAAPALKSYDPPPATRENRSPAKGLRLEVDHTLRYRGR
jgi:hypothetical protein